MRKFRIFTCLLAATVIAASLAGCGGADTKASSDNAAAKQDQSGEQRSFQGEKGSFAKVVSLNGDQLTVVLADRPAGREDGATPPAIGSQQDNGAQGNDQAAQNGAAPSDNAAPPSGGNGPAPASGSSGDGASPGAMHQRPDGQNQWGGGNGGREMTFSGENVIYTLSSEVTITKGRGDSATKIDLSELKAGDLIRFTTTKDDSGNETIDTITVMGS